MPVTGKGQIFKNKVTQNFQLSNLTSEDNRNFWTGRCGSHITQLENPHIRISKAVIFWQSWALHGEFPCRKKLSYIPNKLLFTLTSGNSRKTFCGVCQTRDYVDEVSSRGLHEEERHYKPQTRSQLRKVLKSLSLWLCKVNEGSFR